jgi:hypothetical protein
VGLSGPIIFMDLVDEFLEVSSSWRCIPGKIIQRRCAWLSQESARSIRWGGDAHASAVLFCVCNELCLGYLQHFNPGGWFGIVFIFPYIGNNNPN